MDRPSDGWTDQWPDRLTKRVVESHAHNLKNCFIFGNFSLVILSTEPVASKKETSILHKNTKICVCIILVTRQCHKKKRNKKQFLLLFFFLCSFFFILFSLFFGFFVCFFVFFSFALCSLFLFCF